MRRKQNIYDFNEKFAFLSLIKMEASFSYTFFVEIILYELFASRLGATFFVRGFGCALFILGGKKKDEKIFSAYPCDFYDALYFFIV